MMEKFIFNDFILFGFVLLNIFIKIFSKHFNYIKRLPKGDIYCYAIFPKYLFLSDLSGYQNPQQAERRQFLHGPNHPDIIITYKVGYRLPTEICLVIKFYKMLGKAEVYVLY